MKRGALKMLGLFALMVLTYVSAFAQTGAIKGRVLDDRGEGAVGAVIQVKRNGVLVKGSSIYDLGGWFMIRNLDPGVYDLEVTLAGMAPYKLTGIQVPPEKVVDVGTIRLTPKAKTLKEAIVVVYSKPLFKKDQTTSQFTLSKEEIEKLSPRNPADLAATSANVFQRDEGSELNVKGSRTTGNVMIIDGMKIFGSNINLPKGAIEQISTITGGVPAKYGDATGGIITVTTKGPSANPGFGFEAVTSQFLDPYGYNLVGASFTTPLLWEEGVNEKGEKVKKRPILGMFFSGEYNYQKDYRPSFYIFKMKDSVFQDVVNEPLIKTEQGAFIKKVETLRRDAFEPIKYRLNAYRNRVSLSTKFDFSPKENLNITLGGFYINEWGRAYVHRYSLMNWERQPWTKNRQFNTMLRLRQEFPTKDTAAIIRDFSYSIQFEYRNQFSTTADFYHRYEPFNYGYIGKFMQREVPFYFLSTDSALSALAGRPIIINNVYLGSIYLIDTFIPGGLNPYLENITKQYLENAVGDQSIGSVINGPAIANGERTLADYTSYSIWFIPGRQYGGYSFNTNSRFRVWFNGAFSIIPKKKKGQGKENHHNIEFGMEYEQETRRGYSIGAVSLWTLARLYVNRHLAELNLSDPILIIDGQQYRFSEIKDKLIAGEITFDPESDTVYYEPLYRASEQAWIDKKLREKLGLPVDGTDNIPVDTLSPDVFSLDMFAPDELWLEGINSLVSYYGYNYIGNIDKNKVTFKDFWTAKDENGNYLRPIAPYRPIYMAFYVQDKFMYRDLIFNVGLRVDRFDANQKVLKDKYLLLPAYTTGEVDPALNPNGKHPDNISDDYVVYVDNAKEPTTILGYRKGDEWYDAQGRLIEDPGVIAAQTVTGTIQPYLKNPDITEKDPEYDPDQVFTDYTPQWTIMPRIAFSFPISDKANFYAHYDVLTQRPRQGILATPDEFYFLRDIAVNNIISNPALKPEKVIDYEVGFRQKVSDNVAISISGFYRELRDMIQVTRVNYAYPVTYRTFDNLDFGTVKGMTFKFDMRRIPNKLPLQLAVNYTLQFAQGTGSNVTSQLGLINFGEPNLRVIIPLDYDQRHTIVVIADYRYGEKQGPTFKGKHIFENAGVNLLINAGSGTPFTVDAFPTRSAVQIGVNERTSIKGGVNTARKPWTLRMDLKIDKTFKVKVGTREIDGKTVDLKLPINVYLWVQNLLNNRNVLAVWRATGSPIDDGYLSSPVGQQYVSQQVDPQAFADQYRLYTMNPFNFGQPRRIRIGVMLGF
ncbi:MAG: TonB-dependent receptor plug domain-containing protein [Chlorobi bacterium]|nr:TonB-dependent receptor plug domain-containing protein [Chlorobiota bacterium]